MIKAIVIDDEERARSVIKKMIEKHTSNVKVVAEAGAIEEGVEVILKEKPDLVFLDIQMREGTGFDLLGKLDEINFEVIFVTAYNQYALEAFKFSAFGYLLKPVQTKEFCKVVNKIESQLMSLKEGVDKRMKVLIENYGKEGEIQKLIISNMKGFQVISIDKIIRLEGDGNYTHFITSDKKITTAKNIGEYEKLLNNYGFFRIHQSSIVNLRKVEEYNRGEGIVTLSNGDHLKVSRDKKKTFIKKFI